MTILTIAVVLSTHLIIPLLTTNADRLHLQAALNQTSQDWHTRIVTLNEVKGLALRFFAALRMTTLEGHIVKCTNVLHSGLDAPRTTEIRLQAASTDKGGHRQHALELMRRAIQQVE